MSTEKTTQDAIGHAVELDEGQLAQVAGGLVSASEPPDPNRAVTSPPPDPVRAAMGEPPDPNRVFKPRTS